MAWTERLPSGRYRGIYRDRSGKRHTLPDTYTREAEAKREAGLAEDKARRNARYRKTAGGITWGQWCDEWVAEHRKVEPGTAGRDESYIARHIRPHWAHVALRDIDRGAVGEWVKELRTKPKYGQENKRHPETLSARTVLKIVNIFSASMRDAVRADPPKIDTSPCQYLEVQRPEADDEYYLERAEYDRLVEACDENTRMLVEFAVGTGLRWGEIAGMHRGRIFTEQRRVLVQEVFDKQHSEIKPYPKGQHRRGVPITAELAERLDAWMAEHPAKPCRTPHRGGKRCGDALLFPTSKGTALNYGNFRRRRWDHAVAEAGLVGLTPHDLRHTYASWMIQSKRVTLGGLRVLLGHKSRETTDRYAHFGEDHWDDARAALGDNQGQDEPDEDTVRAAIAKLAAEKPGEWGAVAEALEGVTGEDGEHVAPDLPHDGGEPTDDKIVKLDRWRRSTG